jgi:hypothetical protein
MQESKRLLSQRLSLNVPLAMLLPEPVVPSLFKPNGSKYFLSVITPSGDMLEGQHFHLLYYAQRGIDLLLLTLEYKGCSVVLFDWEGKVIECRFVQTP